jgi:hypothetical protein
MPNWDTRSELAAQAVMKLEGGHICEPQEFSICCGYPKDVEWPMFCIRCGEKATWETVCFKCEEE